MSFFLKIIMYGLTKLSGVAARLFPLVWAMVPRPLSFIGLELLS